MPQIRRTRAPEIETDRLILRGHRRDDFPVLAAMWADPGVTRFISDRPATEHESWMRYLRYAGHWIVMGYGFWAVTRKDTAAFIGEIGFSDFKRPIDLPIRGLPEAGWAFVSSAHGQGYAGEALTACLTWADKVARFPLTTCIIEPENAPSIRLAERAGYVRATMIAGTDGAPVGLYERPRPKSR
ncbi:MAG: Acetyltransferase family protein [Proteobacteria bacterium]|nr:Acetyltransferase family protein [Pseudomonadota bacterium]